MKTLSQEQFKQKYGEVGLTQFAQTAKAQKEPGYFSRVGSQVKDNLSEAFQSEKSFASNPNATLGQGLAAGANIAKNLSGAVLAPLTQAPGFKQLGEGFGKAGEAIVNTDLGNKLTDTLANNFSPETLGTASDVVETGLNVAGIYGGVKGGKALIEKGKNAVGQMKANADTPPPPTDQQITLDAAIKDATPDYESSTPTGKGKLLDRTQEGGFLKGRTVKPNALETEAGTELSKVPGYDPASTKLAKYQATKAEISKQGQAFKESLKNERTVVPKKEVASTVVKAVNEVPTKSLLLQSSDPIIKQYIRVMKAALVKEPGNLSGVQSLIETLDDAYENARGKQAFGSDKISALDDVHKASRDALTKYLIEKAQNTSVKAMKRALWNLYRATDMLRLAAEKESGSVIGRAIQKHPVTAKVVKALSNAVGIGQAVNTLAP